MQYLTMPPTLIKAPFFLLTCFLVLRCIAAAYPFKDMQNCKQLMGTNKTLLVFDALPGKGFDNLRNLVIGQVYQYSYSTCQISDDGIYLLPDGVFLVPVQRTDLDLYAQYFDHFDKITSETSKSINVEAEVVSWAASGKFSADFQRNKMHMVSNNATSTRAIVRHHLCTAIIHPDAQLHPRFKARIMDLVAYIQNESQLAHYFAELLVLNYGTHIITHVDAGASLSQTTMLSKNSVIDSGLSKSDISASASIDFFATFKAEYSQKSSDESIESFYRATKYKHIASHGGLPLQMGNFSVQDWEASVPDHLVAIDRSGQPLWTALTTSNMPELGGSTLQRVIDYIRMAVDNYYTVNTHHGCTDPDSQNFNYYANVDDKSCDQESRNFSLGGVYQKCECLREHYYPYFTKTNPFTGGYSCPPGYSPMPLHTLQIDSEYCYCHDRKCTCESFWCALNRSNDDVPQFIFGGLHTPTHNNLVTKARKCPPYFISLSILANIVVCVSNDDRSLPYSLPFGGFYSCRNGNRLANNQTDPKACPIHYDSLMVYMFNNNCPINYCTVIKTVVDYEPVPPKLPPYNKKPEKLSNVTDMSMCVQGTKGRTWVKDEDGNWVKYKNGSCTNYNEDLQSTTEESSSINIPSKSLTPVLAPSNTPSLTDLDSNKSAGVRIAVPIVVVFVIFVLAVVIISGIVYCRIKKKCTYQNV